MLVATLEGDTVLLRPAWSEYRVIPVGIGSVVAVCLEGCIGDVAKVLLVLDISGCVEELSLLAQRLEGEHTIISNA